MVIADNETTPLFIINVEACREAALQDAADANDADAFNAYEQAWFCYLDNFMTSMGWKVVLDYDGAKSVPGRLWTTDSDERGVIDSMSRDWEDSRDFWDWY